MANHSDTIARDAGMRRMPVPGERERDTLTYGPPGSMGGPAAGAVVPAGGSLMDAATTAERRKEGGGALSQRQPRHGH